ncbi:MAG: Gldg family protein [Kiritimatiellae bacterium]|nr:Gldg family protein [Kiritimatiellia bacterium]MDW8459070.1 Gldg family protein [Verrucomicrobiota bacterium]
MKPSQAKFLTGAAGLLTALVVLILLNVVASSLRLRADLTEEKLYTLSEGTIRLLEGLQRDVKLKFYFSRSAEDVPPAFKQYGRRIQDLLAEYRDASRGRIEVEVLDPKPDSDAEEWAERYGLAAQRIDPTGENPPVYLGLVALAGARQAAVPFFSPADEPQLEYIISRLIYEASTPVKPKIGLLTTLPVLGTAGTRFGMGRDQEPWLLVQELRAISEVVELSLPLTDIPEDVGTILVIHPRALPEQALYELDQFLLRGGRLAVFVDPICLTELEAYPQPFRDPFSVRSDLNRLTTAWGLSVPEDRVAADNAAATRVSMADGRVDLHRGWLSLRESNLNGRDVTVGSLSLIQIPLGGWIHGEPAEGLTLTPLITLSDQAGSMSAVEASMGAAAGMSSFRREKGPLHVAVRLQGRFKTAFPDGRPGAPEAGEAPGGEGRKAHLSESKTESAVVLVADADLLFDAFAARRLPMFGRGVYQLMNDNLNFAANVLAQLTGGSALIDLRGRAAFDRPFKRVLEMQARAQERWRQEEDKLQEQLRLTQMRLDDLQAAKSEDQKLILTPEQREEIEKFRKQLAETRAQLKEVRKNLRREIEELGLRLKVINIGAVPAMVVLYGLARGLRRRLRAR